MLLFPAWKQDYSNSMNRRLLIPSFLTLLLAFGLNAATVKDREEMEKSSRCIYNDWQ